MKPVDAVNSGKHPQSGSPFAHPRVLADQVYASLPDCWPVNEWLAETAAKARQTLATHRHGDFPRWLEALDAMSAVRPFEKDMDMTVEEGMLSLGSSITGEAGLKESLMQLHPWRKGPIRIAGITIDTEWRSDWKWERIEPHIDVRNRSVLDVGCGNGYFGYRMLEQGARLVVGIDPTLLFVMQWLACRQFAGRAENYVLPLGIEHLPPGTPGFDSVFSMGVLYHRKDHMEHLEHLKTLLRPGGQLVLETLVLPDAQSDEVLVPENRYAAMRNVWALPGTERLLEWVEKAGYSDARLVDVAVTTTKEQRRTDWMQFESLKQALDPDDPNLTREGYPAPRRAFVLATR